MFELLQAVVRCTSLETVHRMLMADDGLQVLDCFLHFLLFWANPSSRTFKFGLKAVLDLLQRELDAHEELRSASKPHSSQKFEKSSK